MHTSNRIGGPSMAERYSSLTALATARPAAFSPAGKDSDGDGIRTEPIAISTIIVKPQDRHDFRDVHQFAERLKIAGRVHTPILVRDLGNGTYELVAGERRTRASTLNGWTTITATIFPPGTPDHVIRRYQVSENIDRKALTTRETAQGVARDIELYGREEAALLWTQPGNTKRSESWLSKHIRWKKYPPITRSIFDQGLFDDIEAANKLCDIEEIDRARAEEIAAQFKDGQKVSRGTLDSVLQTLRAALPTSGSLDLADSARNSMQAPAAAPSADDSHAAASAPTTEEAATQTGATQPETAEGATQSSGAAWPFPTAPNLTGAAAANRSTTPTREASDRSNPATGRGTDVSVVDQRENLYRVYTNAILAFRRLDASLQQSEAEKQEIDWALWVAFSGMVSAALVGVGSDRAKAMLTRLTRELKIQSPVQLLNALHQTPKTGVLPDNFGYDTARNMSPPCPVEWAL